MTQTSHATQPFVTLHGKDLLPQLGQIRSNTPGYLLEVSRRLGHRVKVQLGKQVVFLLSHPDDLRQVLQDRARRYSKDTIQYNTLASITGRGLLTADGEEWLAHRRMAQPAFARARIHRLDEIIVPAAQAALSRWQPGEIMDIDAEMMRLTLGIVGQALFSIDLSRDAARLTRAVLTALDHVVFRAQNFIYPPDSFPTLRNLKFRRALSELDEAVYAILRERQTSQHDDLLGMLLAARAEDSGQALSERQLRDEVITLLIAGHETVASALTWSFYLLAQNPHAAVTLREEVQRVLGGRPPTSADLPNLPYSKQVFDEALRLYPPAWLITRKAEEADEIGGEPVPPGALIVLSPYVVQHHPDFWEEPETFDPGRFAPAQESKRSRFAYIPFGAGPRLCIGAGFAQVEAQLILAMTAQHGCLELLPGAQVKADPLVTLRPHGGLPMRLRAAD